MKKSLLLLGLVVASLTTFGQTTFGIKAGVNLSKLTVSSGGGSISTDPVLGYHIGAAADFAFGNFSIQPGMLLNTKGGQISHDITTVSTTLNYIEVPINFLFKPKIGNDMLFIGGGPYLGFGVSGKNTYNDISEDVHFGVFSDEVNGSDFGLNFLVGYQWTEGFALNFNYGLGMSNLYNSSSESGKFKNQVMSLSISFFFK